MTPLYFPHRLGSRAGGAAIRAINRVLTISASPAVQYVCAAYAGSLITLGLLYFGLPTGHFPVYAQLQGLLNIIIVASALGIPTAAVHLGLLSRGSPQHGFSVVLEQTGIQFCASVLMSGAVAMLLLSGGHAVPQETLYLGLILTASCGLYPLWGVGMSGLYRQFAVALILAKCIQWALFISADSASRLEVWIISQAAIYPGLLVMFIALSLRRGMTYRPTHIPWMDVLRASVRSDLALDVLKVCWANALQLMGGAVGGGEYMNRVLLLDRVSKALVSFVDTVLRLRWYGAKDAAARHFAHWGDRHLTPSIALAAAALAGLVMVTEARVLSAFGLSVALLACAGMLALLNGASEWSRIRGAHGCVRYRSVAVASACIAAAALFWLVRDSAPSYLALCFGLLVGEMLIGLQTQGAGRAQRG